MSIFRASLAEPVSSAQRDIELRACSRLVPPDRTSEPSMFIHAPPKGLGNDLGRHFLKREGALIHYPCACVHFFTDFFEPAPAPNEIDAALE